MPSRTVKRDQRQKINRRSRRLWTRYVPNMMDGACMTFLIPEGSLVHVHDEHADDFIHAMVAPRGMFMVAAWVDARAPVKAKSANIDQLRFRGAFAAALNLAVEDEACSKDEAREMLEQSDWGTDRFELIELVKKAFPNADAVCYGDSRQRIELKLLSKEMLDAYEEQRVDQEDFVQKIMYRGSSAKR